MKFASKSEQVHYIFSHIAKRYDLMNSVLSFSQHKLWRSFANQKISKVLLPGGSAIDVCAGTGDWSIALAEMVGSDGRVVALDFCQEMLDVAAPKFARKGVERQTNLVLGDAMRLPYPDNEFDVATIGFALRNVPGISGALSEMMRVVKPGGMVVSLELSKPTWPPFRALYYFYFYKLLPVLGRFAVGGWEPYRYLPNSLTEFPGQSELANLFASVGMLDVEVYPLTGGIAAVHIGRKPR